MKLFPAVSLSELRANLDRDRQKFQESSTHFTNLFHSKTRPLRLIFSRPGLLIGGLTSIFALYEMGTAFLPAKAVSGKTLGLVSRVARIGLGLAMRAATPAISAVIQKVWSRAINPSSKNPF